MRTYFNYEGYMRSTHWDESLEKEMTAAVVIAAADFVHEMESGGPGSGRHPGCEICNTNTKGSLCPKCNEAVQKYRAQHGVNHADAIDDLKTMYKKQGEQALRKYSSTFHGDLEQTLKHSLRAGGPGSGRHAGVHTYHGTSVRLAKMILRRGFEAKPVPRDSGVTLKSDKGVFTTTEREMALGYGLKSSQGTGDKVALIVMNKDAPLEQHPGNQSYYTSTKDVGPEHIHHVEVYDYKALDKGSITGKYPKPLEVLKAAWDGVVKPTYPADHKAAMRVPKGGSSCASCKYLVGKDECSSKYYQKWNGNNKIPLPSDEYCSDWYEPTTSINAYGTSEGVTKSWDTRGRKPIEPPPVKPLQLGQTTEEAWKKPNGEWDDKREAWHKAFVENYLAGKQPMNTPPEATIMGGGTAVGKTTLSRKIVGDNTNIVRVDADELKLVIPEYEGLKKSDPEQAATRVHEESSYIAKSILAEGAARGLNLTYDATSSGGGAVKMVQKLASEGYNVHVLFADVPIEVARQRAASRSEDVTNTAGFGRVINDDLMVSSHKMSAQNFLRLKDMPEASSAHLFDTTERTPGMVYGRSGQSNGIVYDESKWGRYMKKATGEADINSAADKALKPGQYQGVDNDVFTSDEDVAEFSKLLNKAKVERIKREKDGN